MRRPGRIAIDGPAGSGKSTVGEQLAHKLGYLYVDTGAMYRAAAWLALQEHIDIFDGPALAQLTRQAQIVISRSTVDDGRQYTVTANGHDITWEIRGTEVTRAVPPVASHPEVRRLMHERQRDMAREQGVVMVGRDIGSIVLPDAELKIYLTASQEERAKRRYAEMQERYNQGKGVEPPPLAIIAEDISRRDASDHDNMRPAHDALIIMTDNLSVTQVLEVIYSYLEESR
ncbi:MAG TPA: (d)CMP kinase [Ktedonobacteraceae bacterium]|nr:(d)CMP kinase [Ktedonobacteraceae bacterium]